MKKYSLFAFYLIAITISSCDFNKSEADEPVSTPPVTNTSQPAATQQTVPVPVANPNKPAAPPVTVAPVQIDQSASTGAATGLNPAHGQPGHDCSIPVGQPLKKTSGTSATPQISTVIPPTGAQQSPTTANPPLQTFSGNKPKINPAHGQPGHRCDIAVGQPLN